jgi:hypothetical protein
VERGNYTERNFIICTHQILLGCHIKQDEINEVHNQQDAYRDVKGTGHLRDLGLYARILQCNLKQTGCKGVDWIPLVQDTVQHRIQHGNELTGFVKGWVLFSLAKRLSASQEWLAPFIWYLYRLVFRTNNCLLRGNTMRGNTIPSTFSIFRPLRNEMAQSLPPHRKLSLNRHK